MHNIPDDVSAADFHLGAGTTIVAAARLDAQRVRLTVDVAWDAELGVRRLAFRASPGDKRVTIYDTVDYLRVEPGEGFARVGRDGNARDPDLRPKQRERLEAVAMCPARRGKPNAADDLRIGVVPARWSIAEMPVRENDDDVNYVGTIDPSTGRFTPAIDGPNPQRKGNANNIGDIFVIAEAVLSTPMRDPDRRSPRRNRDLLRSPRRRRSLRPHPSPWNAPSRCAAISSCSVPIFVRWDRLEWESR
jgi:quinohemoprotein amine dehydrogenase